MDALAAEASLSVPLNDSKMAITIIDNPIPAEPAIIGFFRPR